MDPKHQQPAISESEAKAGYPGLPVWIPTEKEAQELASKIHDNYIVQQPIGNISSKKSSEN